MCGTSGSRVKQNFVTRDSRFFCFFVSGELRQENSFRLAGFFLFQFYFGPAKSPRIILFF